MRIPDVQAKLLLLALEDEREGRIKRARLIRRLVIELYRRKAIKRAPARRKTPPTPMILAVAADNPNLDQCGVSQVLGTNPGRISEALRGKRA